MRVLINALTAAGARTGIGHYTGELLRCLRQQAGPDAVGCFPGFWVRQAYRAWAGLRPRVTRAAEAEARPGWRNTLLRQARRHGLALLERRFRRRAGGGFDVYHEPNYLPFACDLPTVVTLHDLSVLRHPEWHPAHRVAEFARRFHAALPRCVHFLAISEFGRQEVVRTLGVAPGRVTRTYMGTRPGLRPLPADETRAALRALGLPPRYLLYLGTLEPRKNVGTLLRAYCSLPEGVRRQYPLLLVGGYGWNAAGVAALLEGEARHRGARHLGYVAEGHLPALYNGARALAFPSFYEGFGLPPVEMMACGGAVLASTAGALAETVGAKAHLIDPDDVDGWRAALLRVCTDDDWWAELRRGATGVAGRFTWERCAADTLAVYAALAGRRPARAA